MINVSSGGFRYQKRLKTYEIDCLARFLTFNLWNRGFRILGEKVSGIYSIAGRMAYLLLLVVCKGNIPPIARAKRNALAGF